MKKRRLLPFLIVITVLILAGGTTAWLFQTRSTKGPQNREEQAERVFAVNTVIAAKGKINDFLFVNGDIVASQSVNVFADTAGKLLEKRVSVGDKVSKGQIIAYIDPSKPGMSFSKSPVKSPISGTVTAFSNTEGNTVSPQTALATVGNLNDLEVETYIAERNISQIETGQKARLTFEAIPGMEFPAVITELNPVVDPVSRTMKITLKIEQRDKRIKAGMFAKIRITTADRVNTLLIPTDCIVERFGKRFVYIVENTRAVRRPVTEGLHMDNRSEIIGGLNEGEKVVVQGQNLLTDGVSVKVIRESSLEESGL